MTLVLNWVILAMFITLFIPIYTVWKENDVWQKMLALGSFSTKASIMILVVSVLRDDWMIGVVGVNNMSVVNAGLMLLSNIQKRLSDL